MRNADAKHIAVFALLTALALTLSWVESLIPLSLAVPGIKAGLPNIAVVFALYRLRSYAAAGISLLRLSLAALLFGNLFSLAYSAAGAALSLAVMLGLKRAGVFGLTAVSVAGAVAHNLGQLAVAALLLETGRLVLYLPALIVSGVAAGLCVGLLSALLVKRIKI